MKKISAVIIVAFIIGTIMVTFTGCNSIKSPDENQIIADLKNDSDFSAIVSADYENNDFSIKGVNITLLKISDDKKTNIIQVEVTTFNADFEATYTLDINYTYYDKGGWIISSLEKNSKPVEYIPLKAASDDVVMRMLPTAFPLHSDNINNYSNINHETDLENKIDVVTLNFNEESQLFSGSYTLMRTLNFEGCKWRIDDSFDTISNKKIRYNLEGTWTGKEEYGNGENWYDSCIVVISDYNDENHSFKAVVTTNTHTPTWFIINHQEPQIITSTKTYTAAYNSNNRNFTLSSPENTEECYIFFDPKGSIRFSDGSVEKLNPSDSDWSCRLSRQN